MQLTKEENEMLEGKYGYPVQKSMEILVGLGECFDAKRMLPITSAHLLRSGYKGSLVFLKEMADKGGKFACFTDTNPMCIDPLLWEEMGFPEDFARGQMEVTDALITLGAFNSTSCNPYLIGNVPLLGEHVAWSDTTVESFANSVLGARTNRLGGPASLAAALVGRVPEYGYHLDQNRCGEIEIMVTAKLNDAHDYGTLGYFAGRIAGERIPVFTGIPARVSRSELKQLGAATAHSGSIALYHVVGVTPEAATKEVAFKSQKRKNWPKFEFSEKELRETEELLITGKSSEIDLVVFGCPHYSIEDFQRICRLISGKKLKSKVWILTSHIIKTYAEQTGYVDILKKAGSRVICDTCPALFPEGFLKKQGYRVAATDSANMARHLPNIQQVPTYYGSMESCIEAACSGIWR